MSEKVYVTKKDETQIQFRCNDSGILMEISEFFTFMAEGYRYMPAFKNKSWDGKVRLANLRNNTLPFGLLAHLAKFCETRDYELVIDETITNIDRPTIEELQEFVSSIPLTSRGIPIELRDYQFDGFQKGIRDGRTLLISPTGSGKSLIIYMLLRWYLENEEGRVIIIVPTTSLVTQMQKDFADYSETDPSFNADTEVHGIFSGREKYGFTSRVVVTTWQSAVKLDKSWFREFGMVIGDEAHTFKAVSLNKIMSNLTNAEFRIGTTGTIDNLQVNKLVLIGNFGPDHKVISTKELMDAKTLAQLKINCLVLKYPDEIRKLVCKAEYKEEIDYLVSHEGRNRFLTNLAESMDGNCLVLFNFVQKHGKPLLKQIKDKVAKSDPNRKVFFVSGGVAADEREQIRTITDKHDSLVKLHFGKKIVRLPKNENVPLKDGTSKKAKDLTTTDDIDDLWLSPKLMRK